jgi:glycosyltransferase involved in cell wall biosynthesis
LNSSPRAFAKLRSQYKRLPVWLRTRLGHLSTALFGLSWRWKLPPVVGPKAEKSSVCESPSRVTIVSILGTATGVGGAARSLGRFLDRCQVQVSYLDAGGVLSYPVDPKLDLYETFEPTPIATPSSNTIIFQLDPHHIARMIPWLPIDIGAFGHRIGYWVWELDNIPLWWHKLASRVDEIWVPSSFVASAARKALPQKSIHVVPHVIEAPAFSSSEAAEARARLRAALGLDAACFVAAFGFSMRSSMARKNPIAAIEAFGLAFSGDEKACLVLRCIDLHLYPQGHLALKAAILAAKARIILVGQEVAMIDLYHACDVYLSLHRSEGFGLTIAEAMSHGRPVIVTNWSGSCDFVDQSCGYLVDYKLVGVVDPQNIFRSGSGLWAEPNAHIAARALRELADDRGACLRLGEAARRKILQHGRGDEILARLHLPAVTSVERELTS